MPFDPSARRIGGVAVPVDADRVRGALGVRPLVECPVGPVCARLPAKREKALVAEVILLAEIGQRAAEARRRPARLDPVVQKAFQPAPVALDRRPLHPRVRLREVDVLARHCFAPEKGRSRPESRNDASARPGNGQSRPRQATARQAHRARHAAPSGAPSTRPRLAPGRAPTPDGDRPRARGQACAYATPTCRGAPHRLTNRARDGRNSGACGQATARPPKRHSPSRCTSAHHDETNTPPHEAEATPHPANHHCRRRYATDPPPHATPRG